MAAHRKLDRAAFIPYGGAGLCDVRDSHHHGQRVGSSDWLGLCALAIQFDLVPIRIADINGKAVVLLHRFFGKPVRNQSIARLLAFSGAISNAKCWPLPGRS
jgi:hypothetical protein